MVLLAACNFSIRFPLHSKPFLRILLGMNVHQVDFSEGKVSSCILRLSFPLIIAEIVNLLYNMVDRIFIGHIPGVGSAALSGIGLCFPIISLISAFARLYGFNGGAPLCSMARGNGDKEEASYVMGNSVALAIVTGIIIEVVLLVFLKPILYAFGASDISYVYASDYLRIYSLGSVAVLLTLTMNAFINSQGFSQVGMISVLIGALTNIVLDPILIFKFGLGVKGAAIATVISQTLSALYALFFLIGKNAEIELNFKYFKLKRSRCFRIIALGTSGFTMGATNSLVQLVCNKMAFMTGGDLYVGVMTILNSVREIFSTPISGIGSGASPVMSFNYGRRDGERVRKASNFTLYSTLLISLTVWLVVFLFPRYVAMLFTDDAILIDSSVRALKIYFFGFVFMSFQTAGQQTFVALGKAKHAVFFSLFRKVIIVVPLTIILPYFFSSDGVVLAEPISNVVGGLAAYITMRRVVMPELDQMKEESSSKSGGR